MFHGAPARTLTSSSSSSSPSLQPRARVWQDGAGAGCWDFGSVSGMEGVGAAREGEGWRCCGGAGGEADEWVFADFMCFMETQQLPPFSRRRNESQSSRWFARSCVGHLCRVRRRRPPRRPASPPASSLPPLPLCPSPAHFHPHRLRRGGASGRGAFSEAGGSATAEGTRFNVNYSVPEN